MACTKWPIAAMVTPLMGTDTMQNSGQGTIADSGLPVSSSKQRYWLASQLRKTKMCVFQLKGVCERGNKCTFAHSCAELHSSPDLYKTRLCPVYQQGGCDNEDCPFAHGEEELRYNNIFYKKALCIWNEKGKCRSGNKCRFAHGTVELRQKGRGCQGSHGATPASGKQMAAKVGNETEMLQEPVELHGAGCLLAPQPAEPPATILAQARERDQTLRGRGARSPTRTATHSYSMASQMPNMPGAGITSELERIYGDISSFLLKRNEIQMQVEATSPNLSQAYLRDADPHSHLEAATGLVVESTGAGDLQLPMYWL